MDRVKQFFSARLARRPVLMLMGLAIWFGVSLPAGPTWAEAPAITPSGPIGLIHADDLIPVNVLISSGGLSINAAQVTVTFPADRLRVEFIRREQSIFSLWPTIPTWDNQRGTAILNGGRPGGIVSVQSRMATVYFRASKPGPVEVGVSAEGSGLYLNNGSGTRVTVAAATAKLQLSDTLVPGIPLSSVTSPKPNSWSRQNDLSIVWPLEPEVRYSYDFTADCQSVPDDQPETTVGQVEYPSVTDGVYCFTIKSKLGNAPWSTPSQYRFLIDRTPPRPFSILQPSPHAFNGANVLVWTATDDVSDIASTTLAVPGQADRTVASPLTILPGWRGKLLTVTVTDAAGNIQSATWQVAGRLASISPLVSWLVVALVVLLGSLAIFFWRRHR